MRPLLIALLALALPCTAQDKRVVITIDDLPCANCAEGTWGQVTDDLLRVLQAHRVPAIGFVNEGKLYRDGVLDSARYRLLERWLRTGMDLGNHTYAHLGARGHDLATYRTDIEQGERLLRPLMQQHGRPLRYFRHPYLQTGPTPGYHDSLNAVIAELGYTVAPVTFDNDEYIFAYCYEHVKRAGSDSLMQQLAGDYLAYMAGNVSFHEAQAQAFLGRAIPHILLIHANALNATQLDALLSGFEREGYTFIPLEEALRDPCYQLPEATTPYGFSWIRRWRLAAGERPEPMPEVPERVQKLYDAMRARR